MAGNNIESNESPAGKRRNSAGHHIERRVTRHVDNARSVTKQFSHIMHQKIPPINFNPVKDAFQKISAKQFFFWFVLIVCVLFVSNILTNIFTNPSALEDMIVDAEAFAPLLLIVIIILEALITPLPASITAITAGYFFGTFPGMIYAWIGNAIAVAIAFGLARHFGQPLVKKVISPRIFSFYTDLMQRHPIVISILYAVPIFPLIALSFLVGVSTLSFSRFVLSTWPALLVNMLILAYLGENIATAGWTNGFVLAGICLLAVCAALLLGATIRKANQAQKEALKAPAPSLQERK